MDLNFQELNKKWENGFYESEWEPDTLEYTATERKIIYELKTFLPRHMACYDWNLPYAEAILLIFRRHLRANKPLKSENHKNPECDVCGGEHFAFECPDREK